MAFLLSKESNIKSAYSSDEYRPETQWGWLWEPANIFGFELPVRKVAIMYDIRQDSDVIIVTILDFFLVYYLVTSKAFRSMLLGGSEGDRWSWGGD